MFKEFLKEYLNDEFHAVWESFFEPKKAGFFTLKNDLGILEFSKHLFENFYICDDKALLSHSKEFENGDIYIQNPSSFLVPLNLEFQPNDEICDMCASPGGKSIALASLAKNRQISICQAAIESERSRFFVLKENLAKYGLKSIRAYNKDARSIAKSCANRFDKIILDAPCSSYSHFNQNFIEKSPKELKSIAKLQKGLLNAALHALKDGAEMIYSTCTFFPAENEEVIENALKSRFEIEILPLKIPEIAKIKPCKYGVLVLPDELFSAFYICKIRKIKQKLEF